MKRVAVVIATAGGAGYFPMAPGTVGSAVGIVIYLLMRDWPLAWQVALVVAVSIVGIWAGSVAGRHFGKEDPGQVVIDEVAGQLLTLLATGAGLGGIALGFALFRVLDITKPWPAANRAGGSNRAIIRRAGTCNSPKRSRSRKKSATISLLVV